MEPGVYLQRELEERVRQGQGIFRFLREAVLDGIWYWDLEHPEFEWMSPEFWRLFGYDPATKKHLASEWQDMIHPDDLAVALENFEKHCADPSHPYDQIVRYRHRDGSTVWVRCRGMAIRNDAGKPVRMLGAHTDVTALKQAEIALRKMAEELRIANEAKRRFMGGVSHELRTPLHAIVGLAHLLERDQPTPKQQERLEKLIDAGKQLQEIIEGLLDYARLEDDP
jgi:PAS domain S-box-containing protein